MDGSVADARTTVQNPREMAGFWSLLTISWMNNVLKLGSKIPLEEKHLHPTETASEAEGLVKALESEWMAEERKCEVGRTKPSLWRVLIRIIPSKDIIVMGVLRILWSITVNIFPWFLWLFLKSIATPSQNSYASTLPFVLCLLLTSMVRTLLMNQGLMKADVVGIRLKAAVISLVYKRILSLNRCILEDSVSENTINLVSNDAQAIERSLYYSFIFTLVPLDILCALALMWYLVAWQAMIGASIFLLVSVYNSIAASKAGKIRNKAAAQTDKRLTVIKEIVTGIRVVKMYAWEWNFRDLIAQIRRKEISLIRVRGFIISSIYASYFTSGTVAGFISVMALVLTGHSLTSFNVFTLLNILSNLKMYVTIYIGDCLRNLADVKNSCDRLQRLIEKKASLKVNVGDVHTLLPLEVYCKGRQYKPQVIRTESFRPGKPVLISARKREKNDKTQAQAVLANVSSFWNSSSDRAAFQDVSLSATCGQLVGITGPVGSGKTSLLMSILGELPISSGHISCTGKMAYVSQTPWVYSGTVRENIVFGMPFCEEKYNAIVEVCDLKKDLTSFPKNDLTEIGQRGIILSGGQRARVSLARAIYSDADIYLLDDPLSAVDAKVAKHLFNRCIKEFLAGRVRILVTHHLQFLQQADKVLMLENGSVVYQGTFSQMDKDRQGNFTYLTQERLYTDVRDTMKVPPGYETVRAVTAIDKREERVDLKEEDEDRMVGTVKALVYWKYFRAALPAVLIVSLAAFFVVVQVSWVLPYWWLSRMTEMTDEEQKKNVTLLVYGSITAVSLLLTVVSSYCFYLAALRASENLHNEMTKAVLRAPVLFFDTNPTGRILNRFSKDIRNMDDFLPGQFLFAVQLCQLFFSATCLSAATNVWLFLVCTPLIVCFVYLTKYYLKSSREIRRLEAITNSPVYSLLADTVAGLEVIRSSEMEDDFLKKFYRYLDKNTSALIMLMASKRWLAFRGDILTTFLVTAVSAGALVASQSPALAGLSLAFAAETLDSMQFGIQMAAETENHMTSVERVFTYTQIDPEPGYNTDTQPPETWPTEGNLKLCDLSLAYLKGAPATLNNINISVAAKEKVGVVGRTGAGKSSLVAALFRLPEPEGSVVIDDVNIRDLNLQAARRSMAVITQDPVLFSGSLRVNLDPFSLYDDHDVWMALEEVQLKTLVQQLPGHLEFKLKESGSNFSVGERQLLCLARALLQKSKIIILDEATANVDYKTDHLIQDVIRNRFKESTVLTIAHRLNTIMDYDKVIVMDQGRVVEFDKPEVLLQNKTGFFSRLVQSHKTSENQSQ